MSHAFEILTFPVTMSVKEMERRRNAWGDRNVDPMEHGGAYKCSPSHINFINRTFPDYESAAAYLEALSGHYHQNAVRFYVYDKIPETKALVDLQRRIQETQNKINELNAPHYANVKSATVKCKQCGSTLATAYCGRSWCNTCPICRAELRPKTTIDRLSNFQATLKDLSKRYRAEELKLKQKQQSKAKLYWAVGAEEHC